MTQHGSPVPDASADERARAAATEDYGGVPISDDELADVWLAPAETDDAGGIVDPDAADDDADDSEFAGYDPLADDEPPADESTTSPPPMEAPS